MKRYFLIPLLAAAALAAAIPAGAAAPLRVSFQGKLDDSGQPVTGTRSFVFKIYDALSGGTLVWTSQTEAVSVANGVFSVVLETGAPVNLSTGTFAGPRFIEITVDGTLLSPREAVVSSPYALVAQSLAENAAVPLASLEKDPSALSTVNTATNPVDWSQLKSMPAGFSDGVDDTGGALTSKEGGVVTLTPTTTLDFTAAQFDLAAAAPTTLISLAASSVTLQGNAFNGAAQLVQLDGTGKLPVLDGSALTNVTASVIADGAVTLPKMANLAANSIIGNNTGAGAVPLALSIAQVKTLLSLDSVDNTADSAKAVLSAATLTTARAINGTNFNGSAAITVPVNSTNDTANAATVYPLWTTVAGNTAASISTTKLSFVPNTGILTAIGFAGNLTGSVTGSITGSAATLTTPRAINGTNFDGSAAITVPVNSVDDTATNATMYPLWTTAAGNNAAKVSTGKLSFNPSTGLLTATGFSGNLTGSITGSAATLTTSRNINGTGFNGSADITVPVNSADDTTTSNAVYPLWTTAAGNNAAKISTTKISLVPADGTVSLTGGVTASSATTTGNAEFRGVIKAGSSKVQITDATGNLDATKLTGTASVNTSGSAATLTTSRNINGAGFNGSADITVPVNSSDDLTASSEVYPLWTAAAGNTAAKISTTKISLVPADGTVSLAGGITASSATTTGDAEVRGGLTVGGGTKITKHLSATFALTAGATTAPPECVELTGNTLTGAALGDTVVVSADIALPSDFILQAYVSAADTVAIRWCQFAGVGTDPDGAGANYRVDVWKH